MTIRRSRLQGDPAPSTPKKEPIPITGLDEINSAVDAIAEGLNVVLKQTKKLDEKIDGIEPAKPDAWKAKVTQRDPVTGRIKEVVLRPIYDKPSKVN